MSQRENPTMSQPKLILIEPEHKASQQFSNLRQELDRNNIPFEPLFGFDEAKEKIASQDQTTMMVINNSYFDERNIPKEIFAYKNTNVYCYPKESRNKDFSSLRNSQHVINAFKKLSGQDEVVLVSKNVLPTDRMEARSPSTKIRLKSIKKDIKKNKDGVMKQPYEKIMIIHPKNPGNREYTSLFEALKGDKKNVEVLKGQNEVKKFNGDKGLLILEKQVFDDASRFIMSERLDNKIDIAVLGFKKGLLRENHVIATEKASDITDYLLESGIQIPGLRDRLDKNIIASKNIIKSNRGINLNGSMEDVMSPDRQQRNFQQLREGGETSKLIRQEVSSPTGQNMLLNSKVSEAGSVQKSKGKKVKKVGRKNGSSLENSNSIMLHNEPQRVDDKNDVEVHQVKYGEAVQSKQKIEQKHWSVYPDKNKSNPEKSGPLFIMEPRIQQREIEEQRKQKEKQRQRERLLEKQKERELQQQQREQKQRYLQRQRERQMAEAKERQQQFLLANNNYNVNGRNSENQVIYEMSEEYRGSNPSEYMNWNNDSMASKNSLSGHISNSAFNKQPGSPQSRNYTLPQNYSAKNYDNPSETEELRRNSQIGISSRKQSPVLESSGFRNGATASANTNKSIEQNIQSNRSPAIRQMSNKIPPISTTMRSTTQISQPTSNNYTQITKAKGMTIQPATYVPSENKIVSNTSRTVTSTVNREPAEYNSSRAGIIYHQHRNTQNSPSHFENIKQPSTKTYESSNKIGNTIEYESRNRVVHTDNNNSLRANSTNPGVSSYNGNYSDRRKEENNATYSSPYTNLRSNEAHVASSSNTINQSSAYSPRVWNPDDYEKIVDEKGRTIYRAKSPTTINTKSPTTINTNKTLQEPNNLQKIDRERVVVSPTQYDSRRVVGYSDTNRIEVKPSESNIRRVDYYDKNKMVDESRKAIDYDGDKAVYTGDSYSRRVVEYSNRNLNSAYPSEGVRRTVQTVQYEQHRSVQPKEKRPSIQMRVDEIQRGKSIGYKPSNFNNSNYDASSSGSVYSNKVVGITNNASENDRRTSKISRDSYSNQSSALTHHYFASPNAVPLYGEVKPYHSAIATRIDSADMYNNVEKEYQNLSLDANIVHYIIDTSLYNAEAIARNIPAASFKDRLEKVSSATIPDKMSKQELPSSLYDIGFIFTSNPPASVTAGYHIVEINESFAQIDISSDKNLNSGLVGKKNKSCSIKAARPENLTLIKKLLLAPLIEHFIFYQKSDSEMSKVLKLFPNNKFQKFGYHNRKDLENTLSLHLKNKGRLVRALIFVNEKNIRECAPVMNSSINEGTFNMICYLKDRNMDNNTLHYEYPKVTFSNDFNFNSYGSVINFATHQNMHDNSSHDQDQFMSNMELAKTQNNPVQSYKVVGNTYQNASSRQGNLMTISNVSENQRIGEEAAETLRRGLGLEKTQLSHQNFNSLPQQQASRGEGQNSHANLNNIVKRIIYIQDEHRKTRLHEEIQRQFADTYEIKFFTSLENLQLPSNSGVEFVILHPDGDFLGGEVTDRHAMYVMLGEASRLPSGVGKFNSKSELFNYL